MFPDDIDPSSFDLADVLVSVEPVLGDMTVPLSLNFTYTTLIVRNKLQITITGT